MMIRDHTIPRSALISILIIELRIESQNIFVSLIIFYKMLLLLFKATFYIHFFTDFNKGDDISVIPFWAELLLLHCGSLVELD